MKKILLSTLLISIITSFAVADYWLQKANFGGVQRADATGFSLNGKGYIGTGYTGFYSSDWWEFDPTNNSWTQKANFPNTSGLVESCAFTIGANGYVLPFPMSNEFWQFDPIGNMWNPMAAFPGGGRQAAVAFSIDNKGYITTGASSTLGTSLDDLWEYNSSTNTWLQKASLPGGARHYACGFAIGAKGYIGTGMNSSGTSFNDFWAWDQQSNTWSQLANFPGLERREACAFSIGNMGYIGMGSGSNGCNSDFHQYNPATNTWVQKASYVGGLREETTQFSIGPYGYAGTGWNGASAGVMLNDFWEYHPEDSTTGLENIDAVFAELIVGPNPFHNETTISLNEELLIGNVTVILYDNTGKKVIEQPVRDKSFTFYRNGIANGNYILKLFVDGKQVDEKKLIAL